MDTPMILAVVGIVFTVLALAVLAIFQQLRTSIEADAKADDLRLAQHALREAPPGTTPFFIARYTGNKARYFRVYSDDRALLFVSMGPYVAFVEPAVVRGDDQRHWLIQAASAATIGIAAAAGIGTIVLGIVLVAVGRNAANNPQSVSSLVAFGAVVASVILLGLAIAIPIVVWKIHSRGIALDAMPLSKLREQAELDEWSLRVAPENTSDLSIERLDLSDHSRPGAEVGATISFRHTPTGKWRVETATSRDTIDALAAFRSVWNADALNIPASLEAWLPAAQPRFPPASSRTAGPPKVSASPLS